MNTASLLLPALVAVLATPFLLRGLGTSRFGVLSVAWAFINTFGLLDLGIGRALTRFLAGRFENDETREATIIWTALGALTLIGVVGGMMGVAAAGPLAQRFVHGDLSLLPETTWTLRLLSVSIPLVVVSSGLRGILEAHVRFDLTNRVSVPVAILNMLVPVAMLRFAATLTQIVAALVLVRLAATLVLLHSSTRVAPSMRRVRFSWSSLRPLAGFAGWVAVSNASFTFLMQSERFVLGVFGTLAAVAWYSTPADALVRVSWFPVAVLQVLFPLFSQALVADRARASRFATRGLLLVLVSTLPVLALLTAVAPEALSLWLGADFSRHASRATCLLAASVFLNCMSFLPSSILQAAGRADVTGKLYLAQIPLHVAFTALLVRLAGVDGCALGTMLRTAAEGTVMVWLAKRILPPEIRLSRQCAVLNLIGLAVLFGAALPVPIWARLGWAVCSMAALALGAWHWYLDGDERQIVRGWFSRLFMLGRSASPGTLR